MSDFVICINNDSINIHPSLLPRFRGASPVAGAILSGDEFTGVSIMLLDAGDEFFDPHSRDGLCPVNGYRPF